MIIVPKLLKGVWGVEEQKFTSSTLTLSDFIWQFPPVVWQPKAIGGGFAKSERLFQFCISRDVKHKQKWATADGTMHSLGKQSSH